LYTLLAGADFGAGILETFSSQKNTDTISKAIAPVWEANHIWLIIVVVILFMGFPEVYSSLMLSLHIPVMILLIGIIVRGASFTFRYYDIKQEKSHRIYSRFFKLSSIITPFFLGVTLGAVILGRITLNMELGFYRVFIDPWFNLFSASIGIFMVILFSFLASLFLLGEAKKAEDIKEYQKFSRILMGGLVVSGLLVFGAAEWDGFHLFSRFIESPLSIASIVLATLLIPILRKVIQNQRVTWIRLIAGFQTFLILLGWFAIQYPVLVKLQDQPDLTVYNTRAPESTQFQLIIALIIGLLLVIPALAFLFKVFKFGKSEPDY
jgi:cytochrome d ubiquinol oxidase subunit II